MKTALRDWNRRDVLLRMFADFLSVHLSMWCALGIAAYFHGRGHSVAQLQSLLATLGQYYVRFFLPASPLFTLLLLYSGTYTTARSYPLARRLQLVAKASAVAVLVTLAANYLFFREHIIARSVTLAFGFSVIACLISSRAVSSMAARRLVRLSKRQEARQMNRAPILVVGGAGYIGSVLCRRLLESGERVRVLDNLLYGDFAIADLRAHPNFELMVGDCRHIQSVVGAVNGAKAIVDLAAIVGDPACEQDRRSALEINYAATRMLIEVAKGHGIERFLFASSCSVYGAAEVIMDEHSRVAPISLYGQTKVDSENALLHARSESFHPVILRLATVFGQGYRPRFDLLVNLLTAKAAQEGVITIYNEDQWRPFVHVRDIAEGVLLALRAPLATVSAQVYNLGDTTMNFTLASVADEIRKAFPHTAVQYVANADRRNYRVSFEKIRSDLGFQCKWTLREGILELKAALEHGEVTDYTDKLYHNQKFLQAAGEVGADQLDRSIMAAFASSEYMPAAVHIA